MRYLFLITLLFSFFSCQPKTETGNEDSPDPKKPRTIVTTDGEIDDVDSFIRMLLYANEFRIEG